jgi:hypothetical protein
VVSCLRSTHLTQKHTTHTLSFIDPTLELDVYANKPWALSPAVATMNHLSIRRNAGADEANSLSADMAAPPAVTHIITEDALSAVPSSLGADRTKTHDITARRRFFGRQEHRNFPLEGEVGMEFSSGILGELQTAAH